MKTFDIAGADKAGRAALKWLVRDGGLYVAVAETKFWKRDALINYRVGIIDLVTLPRGAPSASRVARVLRILQCGFTRI